MICLFDNDEAGKNLSQEFSTTYNIPHFFVPELENIKDFSDLVKYNSKKKAVEFFTNLKL